MLPDVQFLAVLFSFWILYPGIAFMAVMFAFIAYDQPGRYLSISILVFVLILQFLGKIHIFECIVTHPLWTLVVAVGYFIVGVLYTRYFELPLFCRRRVERYNEDKELFFANWKRNVRVDLETDSQTRTVDDAWIDRCQSSYPEFRNGEFSIRYYKAKILTWMAYWPWFGIWRLIHDLLKEIWEFIYLQFQEMFQKVANRIYKGILKDLSNDKKSGT